MLVTTEAANIELKMIIGRKFRVSPVFKLEFKNVVSFVKLIEFEFSNSVICILFMHVIFC